MEIHILLAGVIWRMARLGIAFGLPAVISRKRPVSARQRSPYPLSSGGGKPMRKIRILLVHHEALMRATLRLLLEAQPDIEVVSEASNRHAAIEKVYETTPDVSYST
jgi:hypothetical protein